MLMALIMSIFFTIISLPGILSLKIFPNTEKSSYTNFHSLIFLKYYKKGNIPNAQ